MTLGGLAIGAELGGYRLEALVGGGGMSAVYRARDLRLGRRVALKFLAPNLADDERVRERFLAESRLAASLDHAGIVPIFEAGEADGRLYMAMRYVEGTDLQALLDRDAPLAPERAVALVAQLAGALDAAHARGLVHRDVKPSNALVAVESGVEHVYLADFGVTEHTMSRGRPPANGQMVGSVDYVAPEQIRGADIDGRADLYSLGCVLYECLTGEVPFRRCTDVATLYAHLEDERSPRELSRETYFRAVADSRNRAQIGPMGWAADYASPANFLGIGNFSCAGAKPHDPNNFNYSQYCHPETDRLIQRAQRAQEASQVTADALWAQVDRRVVDQAAVVPLVNPKQLDFVSSRVGNYQYNPQWGILLDQLWIR